MNFLKKYLPELTLVLALIIALFPDEFKAVGKTLSELLIANGKTNNLLICLILIYICREYWAIKKAKEKEK